MYKSILHACILCFTILFSLSALAAPLRPMEVGGSNYVMWDASEFILKQTDDAWYPNKVKPIVGTFHENPALVEAQLRTLYKNGQRKIAMMLWYASMPRSQGDVWGHLVNSQGATLSLQQQDNLRNILKLVKDIGFTHLQFRFGTQGSADPTSWGSVWNESYYQENWNFICNTRRIVESSLDGSNVRRIYDLDVERGGITTGQSREYQARLWADYATTYGSADTYGFSLIGGSHRLKEMKSILLARTGILPQYYAVDAYDNLRSVLSEFANEIDDRNKPVILQETYYNDAQVKADIDWVRSQLGLNIVYIMQWPNARNSGKKHFSVNYAELFSNYLNSTLVRPLIYASGSGGLDQNSIWINGGNLYADVVVQVRKKVDGSLLGTYSGAELVRYPEMQNQTITFRLRDEPSISALKYNGGLLISVSSPVFGAVSDAYFVKGQPPVINSLGLGCNQSQCIWVSGSNFSSNCVAKLYPGDWSTGQTPVAVIESGSWGLNCSNTLVTFEIPSTIRAQFSSLNVLIHNKDTNMWAEPKFLKIK